MSGVDELGHPSGSRVLETFFLPHQGAMLSMVEAPFGQTTRRALYLRRLSERRYRRVGPRNHGWSWETARLGPHGDITLLEVRYDARGVGAAYLRVLSLGPPRSIRTIASPNKEFRPVRLLSISIDAKWVYHVSGPYMTPGQRHASYFLAKVSTKDGSFLRMGPLRFAGA